MLNKWYYLLSSINCFHFLKIIFSKITHVETQISISLVMVALRFSTFENIFCIYSVFPAWALKFSQPLSMTPKLLETFIIYFPGHMSKKVSMVYREKEEKVVDSKGMYIEFYFILPNCSTKWLHKFIFPQQCLLHCLLTGGVVNLLKPCQCNGHGIASHYSFIRYLSDYCWGWASFQVLIDYLGFLLSELPV